MRNCKLCEQPIYDLNRKKFCSDKCMLDNRTNLNKEYWEKRALEPKTCRRCHETVCEPKMRYHCKSCREIIATPTEHAKCKTCDNKVTRKGCTFCADCRESRKVTAAKKQSCTRKEYNLAKKHGLVAKPNKDGTISSKFTTRGKIAYEGYRTL